MVVGLQDERADVVFNALADATRRDIVRRSLQGDHSVSDLARTYPMSFAAVQKHVAVLQRAGLVTKERRGREQLVRTDIDAVRAAARLLDRFEELWRARLDRFGDVLAEGEATDPSIEPRSP
jgi:DNA-binding transcriptional ArsR family regulator